MKTVVITGSARGLGFEMAKVFRSRGLNVVLSDLSEEKLAEAKDELLREINGAGSVEYKVCDVTISSDISNLINYTKQKFTNIDIWINNAGVNQPDKPIWELTESQIDIVLDVDLKGAIIGSKLVLKTMIEQGSGAIYNIEGYGSNDAMMTGLSMYGTSKRAITYFTQALAKEVADKNLNILVGRLSPGIMITDFITTALGDKDHIELPEKTKKVYNVLGDYPDVVANFLVEKMLENNKNNVHIEWLTNGKAAWRFMTAAFNKRDFFTKK